MKYVRAIRNVLVGLLSILFGCALFGIISLSIVAMPALIGIGVLSLIVYASLTQSDKEEE